MSSYIEATSYTHASGRINQEDVGKLALRIALGDSTLFHGVAKLTGGIDFITDVVVQSRSAVIRCLRCLCRRNRRTPDGDRWLAYANRRCSHRSEHAFRNRAGSYLGALGNRTERWLGTRASGHVPVRRAGRRAAWAR